MSLDLADYKVKARTAVKQFWSEWKKSSAKKPMVGGMDGFIDLIAGIVHANGLTRANLLQRGEPVSLPGYFSPTQSWDLVVVNEGRLIAALKLDSVPGELLVNHVGNGCRDVLSMAMELRAACRGHIFGEPRQPFVGYLVLLEDAPSSRCPVAAISPHFPIFPEFRNTSYANRYNTLCVKLMREGLYTSAAVILSPRSASKSGEYSEMSATTGLRAFVKTLAAHIAEAATP
jgi:hypothetical protein